MFYKSWNKTVVGYTLVFACKALDNSMMALRCCKDSLGRMIADDTSGDCWPIP